MDTHQVQQHDVLDHSLFQFLVNHGMHEGDVSVTCWGCDLTYDYVKINGDYRS